VDNAHPRGVIRTGGLLVGKAVDTVVAVSNVVDPLILVRIMGAGAPVALGKDKGGDMIHEVTIMGHHQMVTIMKVALHVSPPVLVRSMGAERQKIKWVWDLAIDYYLF